MRRRAPLVVALSLVLGAAYALVLGEQTKQRALLLGTRVDKTFSPVCDCATDVAHLTFRLVSAGRITVQMVNSVGRPVTTFLRDRSVRAGWKHFVWHGLNHAGRVLPNGLYLAEVAFPSLHRTLRLPSPIRLDTQPPRLLHVAVHVGRQRVLIR